MVSSIKLVHHALHVVRCYDFVKHFFVNVAIINGESDTWLSESSCSSNSVEVSLSISLELALNLSAWHIKVDNKFNFRNINTSGYEVSGDEHRDILFPELFDDIVSVFLCHL